MNKKCVLYTRLYNFVQPSWWWNATCLVCVLFLLIFVGFKTAAATGISISGPVAFIVGSFATGIAWAATALINQLAKTIYDDIKNGKVDIQPSIPFTSGNLKFDITLATYAAEAAPDAPFDDAFLEEIYCIPAEICLTLHPENFEAYCKSWPLRFPRTHAGHAADFPFFIQYQTNALRERFVREVGNAVSDFDIQVNVTFIMAVYFYKAANAPRPQRKYFSSFLFLRDMLLKPTGSNSLLEFSKINDTFISRFSATVDLIHDRMRQRLSVSYPELVNENGIP